MNNYKNYFTTQIQAIYDSMIGGVTPSLPSGYTFNISEETSYGTDQRESKVITIIIKYLTGTVLATSTVYPVQFIIVCEPGDTEIARTVIDTFARTKSLTSFSSGFEFYKQNYSTTVVMSNFNKTPDGMSSLLFMSGTIVVTSNLSDVAYLKIDGETIKFSSFSIAYTTVLDTQKVSGSEITASKKKLGSSGIAFSCPNHSSTFLSTAFSIANGSASGNTSFSVVLYNASDSIVATIPMILSDYSLVCIPGEMPAVSIKMAR